MEEHFTNYRDEFWFSRLLEILVRRRSFGQEVIVSNKRNPDSASVWDYVNRRIRDVTDAGSFKARLSTEAEGDSLRVDAHIRNGADLSIRFDYAKSRQGKVSLSAEVRFAAEGSEIEYSENNGLQIEGVMSALFDFCRDYEKFESWCLEYSLRGECYHRIGKEIKAELDPILKAREDARDGTRYSTFNFSGGPFFSEKPTCPLRIAIGHEPCPLEEEISLMRGDMEEVARKRKMAARFDEEALDSIVSVRFSMLAGVSRRIGFIFEDGAGPSSRERSCYFTYDFTIREFRYEKERVIGELSAITDFISIFDKRAVLGKKLNPLVAHCRVRTGFLNFKDYTPKQVIIDNG